MQNNAEEILRIVSEFRSKQRIPVCLNFFLFYTLFKVLSWINSKTCAAIVRSSQPLVGVSGRKSAQDEEFLFNSLKFIIKF